MTWEIVLGIIALVGFVGTIAAYAGKQGSVLARLETTLKMLNTTLAELKESNKETHKDIYEKLTKHDGRLARLESKHENDNA